MDALLATFGRQAMNMAMRSGIALTSSFAIHQCSRLLQTVDDKSIRKELRALQKELDERIKIIAPAIELIEFKSGRGNVFLETAVPLAKSLRQSIVSLGKQLEDVAGAEELAQRAPAKSGSPASQSKQLRPILDEMKHLLARIERDAHMLQFAINASGESLSTSLPPGVSPSRLMQASTFVTMGDTQFAAEDPGRPVQIGPSFTLSLYMLFLGHSAGPASSSSAKNATPQKVSSHSKKIHESEPYGFGEDEKRPVWQEVIHKARVRLLRIPPGWEFNRERGYIPSPSSAALSSLGGTGRSATFDSANEYIYHLEIVEDLDDGRVHDTEGTFPRPFDSLPMAGIRESVPIHQISKIFYTNTGRILNIGNGSENDNSPALLLKRDVNAPTPNQVVQDIMKDDEDPDMAPTPDCGESDASSNIQEECDSQLREESGIWEESEYEAASPPERAWSFPQHLDAEWMAFEVFVGDDDDDSSSCTEDGASDNEGRAEISVSKRSPKGQRSSLDSKLMAQIRSISLRSPVGPSYSTPPRASYGELEKEIDSHESFVARSPFRTITSSLSLMEMLIRLTSLQEFQQVTHLSIPDHILTFFLEETATTGLSGEARWKARKGAKQRIGFDPYLDSPHK